jgi:YVTN family beta-propeller protein
MSVRFLGRLGARVSSAGRAFTTLVARIAYREGDESLDRLLVMCGPNAGTLVMRLSAYTAKRLMIVVLGLAAAVALPSSMLLAQPADQTLFVENTNSGDISVVDNARLAVVGTIPVGLSPDDIVASPDESTLYVSRIVRSASGRPSGKGEVVAIDRAARQILWRAPLDGVPNHLAVSPDGKRVYVTLVSTHYVDVVDPTRHVVVDSVDVGVGPHDILVTPDGRRVYVGLILGNKVTIFDATTHAIIRQISFEAGVRPIALTADQSRLFVQLSYFHGFLVVDPATGQTIRRVRLPLAPGQKLPDSMPVTADHGLRITADGRYLIANGSMANLVALYTLPDLSLAGTVPVGTDPNWDTLSPDGTRVYVSNRGSDDVSVIDLAAKREIARIKVGRYPERMTAVASR